MKTVAAELHYLELMDLATHIRRREISPVSATIAQLERIASLDAALYSYALVTADAAIVQAKAAEAEIASGHYRGPLHGIPIGIKDLYWTKGIPTAAGMEIYKNYIPKEDATVVHRLKEAGAVILGKLQLTEGAYSDHHPSVVPPRNPWNAEYWPGISSSGAGVALAAGLCYGALASDTGGSIRWPCAANGLTGIKPTWGRVSRHGVFALAPTLDHVGIMARNTADVAVILSAVAGSDSKDPTTRLEPPSDYMAVKDAGIQGLRIGIDWEWNSNDVDPATQQVLSEATKIFQTLGASIVEIKFPDVTQAVTDWTPNCAVEAAVAHQETYPLHKEKYGSVLTAVIETGRTLSAMDYQQILLRRLDLRGRVNILFKNIDLLLTPVHPFGSLTLDMIQTLGKQPELIAKLQQYTCVFNMTGHPAITLPGGFTASGMPIGFQLIAAHLDEPALIRAGVAYQGATSWHQCHPVSWSISRSGVHRSRRESSSFPPKKAAPHRSWKGIS